MEILAIPNHQCSNHHSNVYFLHVCGALAANDLRCVLDLLKEGNA